MEDDVFLRCIESNMLTDMTLQGIPAISKVIGLFYTTVCVKTQPIHAVFLVKSQKMLALTLNACIDIKAPLSIRLCLILHGANQFETSLVTCNVQV